MSLCENVQEEEGPALLAEPSQRLISLDLSGGAGNAGGGAGGEARRAPLPPAGRTTAARSGTPRKSSPQSTGAPQPPKRVIDAGPDKGQVHREHRYAGPEGHHRKVNVSPHHGSIVAEHE